MDRFLVTILLLASVLGPMTCASELGNKTSGPPEPPQPQPTTSSEKPEPPTTKPPPSPPTPPTTKPPVPPTPPTQPPSSSTTSTPKPTSSTTSSTPAPITTSTTAAPPTTNGTTPAPHPPTPSDRKFEAFSFIGGFALAIGLVAIGFLAWKLYISRRENVYHTL